MTLPVQTFESKAVARTRLTVHDSQRVCSAVNLVLVPADETGDVLGRLQDVL